MNSLLEIISNILNHTKKIDILKLPTQGLFYPSDFEIKIKKADMEDIIDYEYNYDRNNLYVVIESVKKIVRQNTIFNKNYKFEDIKSVDIVYLFLEIVRFTNRKPIQIGFFNEELGKPDLIEFNNQNFNYFNFDDYKKYHDKEKSELLLDDYRFSMPSIGVENCVTKFLVKKSVEPDSKKWNDYSYDFLFFVGNKNHLSFDEIENLVVIFNFDIEESEKKKIKSIVKKFLPLVNYSIKHNNKVIDVKSKLDLETIWK